MSNPKIIPVILCDGSGTRRWPLSRKSFSKQFVPLVGNKSLQQLTLERLAQANNSGTSPKAICVAAEVLKYMQMGRQSIATLGDGLSIAFKTYLGGVGK